MGRYFKVSAFTSLFCLIFLYGFLSLFAKNYSMIEGSVRKTNELLNQNQFIIVAACLILHILPMYFYEKIKEKNRVLGIVVAIYNFPASLIGNIVTLIYIAVLIANIKYLGLKDEYTLKRPEINSLKVKTCEKISKKSQEIRKLIKNSKEDKINETILKKTDEFYGELLSSEISQNFDTDSYLTQSLFLDIFTIEKYYLKKIKNEIDKGNREKGSLDYLKVWDVNRKLLRSREKSYIAEVITEASMSRLVDFYFENMDKFDKKLIKSIEFEKINSELKSSFKDSYVFEFYYLNGVIENLKTGVLQKPFINNTLMKKAMEARYISIFEQYDNPEEKIATEYDNLINSPGLTAPVTVILMKISNPDMENYNSRNRAARTKMSLMNYVVNFDGKFSQESMPYSFVTGQQLKLEKIVEGKNNKLYNVKVAEKRGIYWEKAVKDYQF